jgi:hypothetical protein
MISPLQTPLFPLVSMTGGIETGGIETGGIDTGGIGTGAIGAAGASASTQQTPAPVAPASQPASGSAPSSGLLSSTVLQQLLQLQSQQSGTTNAPAAGTSVTGSSVTGSSSGSDQTQADAAVGALVTLGAKQAASGQVSLGAPYQTTLFNVASGNSGGALTQSELQQSVIAGGGTAQDANALFNQLDPSGTGTVSETQMASQLATPVSGDTFGNGLADYLNAKQTADGLQQNLLQQLAGIGLTQTQASSLAQQMQSARLA